jgi:NAD-dependent deacetylase
MMNEVRKAARLVAEGRSTVALTGAGISVESGIPDFRSENGLWSRYEPMEYGHISAFRANPKKVWKMLLEMDALLGAARPNPAHLALARLEELDLLKVVITQNVDSLHQKAGSRRVIEFHGHGRALRCDECGGKLSRESVDLGEEPVVCSCGSAMRPEFVFFGEQIPQEAYAGAVEAVRNCDVMLVIGTSAAVAPASHLPFLAKRGGAVIIVVDPQTIELPSVYIDLHIAEPAGKALPAMVMALNDHGG